MVIGSGAILHSALIRQTLVFAGGLCGVCFIRWDYVTIADGHFDLEDIKEKR